MTAALKKASGVRDQFQRELQSLEADRPNRSGEFMRQAIHKLRSDYMNKCAGPLADAQRLAQNIGADLHYWPSTQFMLSRERFDKDDDRNENAIENVMGEISGRRVDPLAAARNGLAPSIEPTLSFDLPGKLPGMDGDTMPAEPPQQRSNALREPA